MASLASSAAASALNLIDQSVVIDGSISEERARNLAESGIKSVVVFSKETDGDNW